MGMNADDPNRPSGIWFSFSLNWQFWGAGVKGQAGPLKGEAAFSVLNAEGKIKKEGDNINIEATGTIGNVEFGGSVGNYLEGKASGSIAEGTINARSGGIDGEGELITGNLEFSSRTTQSKYKTSGNLFPGSTNTEQVNLPIGSNVDHYTFSFDGKLGPVRVGVGANPAIVSANAVLVANSYAQQATGQRPPSFSYILLRTVFGFGKEK
jgi:hypothetical protein